MRNNTWSASELAVTLSKLLDQLADLARTFPGVPPELMERRALLRRTDSKFLVPLGDVPELLEALQGDYGALEAGAVNLARYRTLYFDTPELRCFHDHRRGVRPRHKVRIRHYPDRQLTFLEVKTKRSSATTYKYRSAKRFEHDQLEDGDHGFVDHHTDLDSTRLEPAAWTNFRRLSLVGLDTSERVSVDVELQLESNGQSTELDDVAVVEVKQAPFCVRTPAMQRLRERGLRPVSNSKYVTAIAFGRPEVRTNRLAPTLRLLDGLL